MTGRQKQGARRVVLAAGVAVAALVAGCSTTPTVSGRPGPTLSVISPSAGTSSASAAPTVTAPTAGTTPSAPAPTPVRSTARPGAVASTTRVTGSVHYLSREPLPHGCLLVSPAITGIKVYLVQRALHLVGHKERYDAATVAAVRAFQQAHHLPVTGTVDATTWVALGTGYDFCVDRYTQQPVVPLGATSAARIAAMIGYASARIGVPYVWGGAGPMGFDCSGMVLQAMYAAGVQVVGISTDLHVLADFRTTQALYASKLPHVPYSQRRRGDLIFYGSPISHMAIYLGGGRIIEAVRPGIRTASTLADGLPARAYVVRPFP